MTDERHTKDQGRRSPRSARPPKAAEAEPQEAPSAAVAEETEIGAEGQIAVLVAERDEYLDHLRRLKAEFENYRKRVQRDGEEMRLRAAETVVESLLPVLDNLDRAIAAAGDDDESQLLPGVQLVAAQLRGTLEGHGLTPVDVAEGTEFDPNVHEAVLVQASDRHPEGTVTQVLEPGYLLHGRLLRPAKVIVAS